VQGRSLGRARGNVAPDQRLDERLLEADELGAVALQLVARGTDGAQGLALVDDAANLVAERLDGGKFDDGCVHDRL
jgi:hypothetical protein